MKKNYSLVSILLAGIVTVLSLAGCGEESSGNPKPEDYIELGTYKGIEYKMASEEVTDEEVDEELAMLLSSFSSTETLSDGVVEDGDTANIDYVGKLNGVAFNGGTAEGYDLVIGSHNFIDGFESGLIGVSVGETVDLNLTFPEQYQSAELAGQDVIFTVTVNSIKRTVLPELTDEFIEDISKGQYTNVDDYKAALVEQIQQEKNDNSLSYAYVGIKDIAVENATVKKDIPQEYIQGKLDRIKKNTEEYAASAGVTLEDFISSYMGMTPTEYDLQALDYAKTAAKESLVIRAIADAEGIEVSEEELSEAINTYVTQYNYESEEAFREATNMDDFEEYILISKIEEFLYENAVITE